jgi:hypothetical protein
VECPSQVASCTKCFKKISVYLFSELIYEFNCCAFYSMHENELYVVVVNLLVAFTFLTSMDNCMSLISCCS